MRVMIVGASQDSSKYGYKAVAAYSRQGHEVLPVNPRGGDIYGHHVFESIDDIPGPIDRASIYLPPDKGFAVIDAIAERGDVSEVWLNPGAESEDLIAHARSKGIEPILACSIVDIGETP